MSAQEPSESTPIRYFVHFEIVREIARSGTRVVFEDRDVSRNRPVVLKMVRAGRLADQADIRRLHNEVQALAFLDHPGIVPVFEVGELYAQHYFCMAFIEGQNLSQRLTEGPLPALDAAELMRRVSVAMDYAQLRGVLHRDLQPANIVLDGNGNPVVTGFGQAWRADGKSGLRESSQVISAPGYMAPERLAGRPGEPGPAADVYSLGATLYALLTGRPPFGAATLTDTLRQVLSEKPVRPRRIDASIPRDLQKICLHCLEKQSGRRYLRSGDLAADLRRFRDFRD
jgi:serine/threonine protein kinase